MNNRFIYLMPGHGIPDESPFLKPETCTIEVLDTGSSSQFAKETNPKMAGLVIAQQRWQLIQVQNSAFNQTRPNAGIQLNESEILIFGGITNSNFVFDIRTQKVEKTQSNLQVKGNFSKQSDFIARTFGSFIYAIDSSARNLHVYAVKEKIWNYSPLSDLGIK